MPFPVEEVLWGFVVPAVTAGLLLALLRYLLPDTLSARYPGPLSLLGGFLFGYAMLSVAPWQPTTHWHWVIYLVAGAAIGGATALAQGLWNFERWLLYALVGIVAAWLIVPDWDDLEPSRGVWLIGLALSMVVIPALLEPLAARTSGFMIGAVLCLCMMAAAGVLVSSGNNRMAQIVGAGAGAMLGCALAALGSRERGSLGGLALPYAVMTVGLMFAGRVNSYSSVPLIAYVLPPLAPLCLGFCLWGQPSRKRMVLGLMLVAVPLVVAMVLAEMANMGDQEY